MLLLAPLLLLVGTWLMAGGGTGAATEAASDAVTEPPAAASARVPVPVADLSTPSASPKGKRSATPSPDPGPPPAAPESVAVPALGVRAAVTPIATVGGALTPPSDPQQIGWWSGGAKPGSARGATVMTGHTVHTGGGAFDDLDRLEPGEEVRVRTATGALTYDIEDVQVLSRADLARASADIFGRGGPARLVLITCEDWNGSEYLSNVVVTATPTV